MFSRLTRNSKSQQNLCESCGKYPKFVEKGGIVHPYCSRTCAKTMQPTCKLPGCQEVGKSAFGGFCGLRHSRSGGQAGQQTPCYQCGKQPEAINGLCFQCNYSRGDNESRLVEVNRKDPKFISLADHMVKEWKGAEKVDVHKIYEIFLPKAEYESREQYRMNLEAFGKTLQLRTFRGAQRICDLGTAGPSLCDWASCGICTIVKSSFMALEFGATSNPGRYGDGIYSYFDPSKADKFATSSVSSPYRAILLCEVNIPGPRSNASKSPMVAKSLEDGERAYVSSAKAIIPKFVILYTKV